MELETTNNNSVGKMELNFVERVECQIESPEKECLSPKSCPLSALRDEQLDAEPESQVPNKLELDVMENDNEEKHPENDNGLDNCPDSESDKYTERQETVITMDTPDTVISPVKAGPKSIVDAPNVSDDDEINDESFEVLHISEEENEPTHTDTKDDGSKGVSDTDPANALSDDVALDTANNNLAQNNTTEVEIAHIETNVQSENGNSSFADIQLVSEYSVEVVEDDVKLVPASPESSNVNLYWYSNTASLDPIEIQEFQKMQVENDEEIGENDSSIRDDYYYKSKLEATTKQPIRDDTSFSDTNMSSGNDEKSWSLAFQSASSRALDVASEQTADPKDIKNRENISIRENGVSVAHPWGLVADSRLVVDTNRPKIDVLPTLESLTENIEASHVDDNNDIAVVANENPVSSNNTDIDAQDAIDEKENTCNENIPLPSEPSNMDIDADHTDAVGYMELKDKAEIQSSQLVSASNVEDISFLSSQDKNSEAHKDPVDVHTEVKISKNNNSNNIEPGIDVTDSVDNTGLVAEDAVKTIETNEGIINSEIAEEIVALVAQSTESEVLTRKQDNEDILDTMTADINIVEAQILTDSNILSERMDSVDKDDDELKNIQELNPEVNIESEVETRKVDHEDSMDTNNVDINIVEDQILTDSNILSERMDSVYKDDDELKNIEEPNPKVKIEVKSKICDPIEVERKFRIADDTEEKIRKLDGKLEKTLTFTDKYLDDDSYTLTLKDCWLRIRNNKYELKTNAAGSSFSPSTQYNETDNEDTIKEFLINLFDVTDIVNREEPLSDILSECGLQEFAVFETTRKTYRLEDCMVDLDQTDFGYQVGEIEVMADCPAEVAKALDIIEKVAGQLGIKSGSRLSKIETYLRSTSPLLYDKMVKAGVF